MWRLAWEGFGPHCPQEPNWMWGKVNDRFPRQPDSINSMTAVRQWVDGYDTGIRYADEWLGKIMAKLKSLGIYDETIIVIGADHGENIGELNVWGDHQTADHITCNVPLIICYPRLGDREQVDTALHYHFDWTATMIELLGGTVPGNWDGRSFAEAFRAGEQDGREFLVTSQGAWACQRGVRFVHKDQNYLCLRTYHDGYKALEPIMLFNLDQDHHLQNDLVTKQPEIADKAMSLLESWIHHQMLTSEYDIDPLMTVMREGGPFYTRGLLLRYIERLKATGRTHHAERLAAIHPEELIQK
jgi:arylsulfatase A-like enzyme